VPQLLEPLHQIPLETVGVDAIEVVSAKILVVALILLQVIANDDEGMRHRDDGSLLAAPCRYSLTHFFLIEFKQSLLVGLSPFCGSNIFVRFRFF
jgi:hypothetical protein